MRIFKKELDITNIETEDDLVVVYGDPALLYEIKEAVETIENAKVESFEKTRIPDEYIELTDEEDIVKFDRLLTLLEDVDDVQAKKLAHILVPVKESANKDKTPATKTETKTKTKTKEDETKKDESENGGNE